MGGFQFRWFELKELLLKHNYWYFTKAIKKEKCDEIISTCLKQKQEKGAIAPTVKNSSHTTSVNSKYRDCKVHWINKEWIYDILNPFIHSANKQAGWNFQWDWNEPSQFTIYNKNQFYDWHCDQISTYDIDNNSKFSNKKNFKNKTRKLSLTLQLTDPSEYEGGDFQFRWFKEKTIKIETPKRAKELGTVIIFPSFICHRVAPIIKGKRQSLVNWSLGKPFI